MNKRRLLVTGSRGFVGSTLIEAVKSKYDNFDVINFVDPKYNTRPDIRDYEAVGRAITSAQADCFVHLAAVAMPREAKRNPTTAWMTNVIGTLNIANAILRNSPQTHLIWSGSSEAYGNSFNTNVNPISEAIKLEPLTPYAATKAASDTMLRQMANDGLKVTIFRPFNHTGPKQSREYVVPAFAAQIAKIEAGLQEPVIQVGNLEAKRDFLHVSDVVSAYLSAASLGPYSYNKTYNVSTGKPISIEQVLTTLLKFSSVEIQTEVDTELYFPNSVPVASGEYKQLHNDLDWAPSLSIEQTLLTVLEYQRDQISKSS